MRNLTPRQETFCQEYLVDLNARKAMVRSGYAAGSSDKGASKLLIKPHISARIQELRESRNMRAQVTADDVLLELKRLAFQSAADLHVDWEQLKDFDDLTPDQKAAISEIKIKRRKQVMGSGPNAELWEIEERSVKMYDKLRALESLAKHVGLYEADNRQKQLPDITFNLVDSNPKTEEE